MSNTSRTEVGEKLQDKGYQGMAIYKDYYKGNEACLKDYQRETINGVRVKAKQSRNFFSYVILSDGRQR